MTEQYNNNKYIICSGCRCKYINDEEHINNDFGYTRLDERYKTCVKCRAQKQIRSTTYFENHPDRLKARSKQDYEAHKKEAQ